MTLNKNRNNKQAVCKMQTACLFKFFFFALLTPHRLTHFFRLCNQRLLRSFTYVSFTTAVILCFANAPPTSVAVCLTPHRLTLFCSCGTRTFVLRSYVTDIMLRVLLVFAVAKPIPTLHIGSRFFPPVQSKIASFIHLRFIHNGGDIMFRQCSADSRRRVLDSTSAHAPISQ